MYFQWRHFFLGLFFLGGLCQPENIHSNTVWVEVWVGEAPQVSCKDWRYPGSEIMFSFFFGWWWLISLWLSRADKSFDNFKKEILDSKPIPSLLEVFRWLSWKKWSTGSGIFTKNFQVFYQNHDMKYMKPLKSKPYRNPICKKNMYFIEALVNWSKRLSCKEASEEYISTEEDSLSIWPCLLGRMIPGKFVTEWWVVREKNH